MTRLFENMDTREMIQAIERGTQFTPEEKKYIPIRELLADISISLAIIADTLSGNKEKDKECEDCHFVDYAAEAEPCCRCSNSHNSMWRAKE